MVGFYFYHMLTPHFLVVECALVPVAALLTVPEGDTHTLLTKIAQNRWLSSLGVQLRKVSPAQCPAATDAAAATPPSQTRPALAIRSGEDKDDKEEAQTHLNHQQHVGRTWSVV